MIVLCYRKAQRHTHYTTNNKRRIRISLHYQMVTKRLRNQN